jgi:hypothetical protein
VVEEELHTFESRAQALAVHYEYQAMEYFVGDMIDYQEDATILEPWNPV